MNKKSLTQIISKRHSSTVALIGLRRVKAEMSFIVFGCPKLGLKKSLFTLPCCQTWKPLMIGFDVALRKIAPPGMSRQAIRAALKKRVAQADYLKSLATEGAVRIDIAADVVEPVSALHREMAVRRLAGTV